MEHTLQGIRNLTSALWLEIKYADRLQQRCYYEIPKCGGAKLRSMYINSRSEHLQPAETGAGARTQKLLRQRSPISASQERLLKRSDAKTRVAHARGSGEHWTAGSSGRRGGGGAGTCSAQSRSGETSLKGEKKKGSGQELSKPGRPPQSVHRRNHPPPRPSQLYARIAYGIMATRASPRDSGGTRGTRRAPNEDRSLSPRR